MKFYTSLRILFSDVLSEYRNRSEVKELEDQLEMEER